MTGKGTKMLYYTNVRKGGNSDMALNSYFDFAENDFQYFKASYDAGIVANMMGACTGNMRKIYETSDLRIL